MKKVVLRFGLYSIYAMLGFFLIEWLLLGQSKNYGIREISGWVGILLAVIFVYFGLKYYRDKHKGGSLSFGEGLKLGLLIVLFPSFAFGVFNVIYVTVLDPAFTDKYYSYQIEKIRDTVPASELGQRMKEMQDQREMFSSPFVQFIVMFLSVFIAGLIVTVISALILKRKAAQSAG